MLRSGVAKSYSSVVVFNVLLVMLLEKEMLFLRVNFRFLLFHLFQFMLIRNGGLMLVLFLFLPKLCLCCTFSVIFQSCLPLKPVLRYKWCLLWFVKVSIEHIQMLLFALSVGLVFENTGGVPNYRNIYTRQCNITTALQTIATHLLWSLMTPQTFSVIMEHYEL